MNKPEYSDLYKFIASIGLFLIGFAVVLPWLFLSESFDSLISVKDISNLTDPAQELISYRQYTALWFIKNLDKISPIIGVIGIVFLFYGLWKWQKKQRIIDQNEIWDHEKKRLENLSQYEQYEKANNDLVEENIGESVEDDSDETKPIEKPEISAVNKYLQIENFVIEKIEKCFGSVNVVSHRQVGDKNIDIVIRLKRDTRIIFEIKSLNPNNSDISLRYELAKTYLFRTIMEYNSIFKSRNSFGVALFIVKDINAEMWFSKPFPRKITTSKNGILMKIFTLTESEIMNIECSELRSLIID